MMRTISRGSSRSCRTTIQSTATTMIIRNSPLATRWYVVLLIVALLPAAADSLIAPPSDEASYRQCPAAAALQLNEAVTVSLGFGDETGSSEEGAVLFCNSDSDSEDGYYEIERKKNTWFTVQGTGEVLTASVCSNGGIDGGDDSDSDLLDAGLTVYQDECITPACADAFFSDGPGCPGLCVASTGSTSSSSNADCRLSRSLSFRSDRNRTYYVQVWQRRDSLYAAPIQQVGATTKTAEPCPGTAQLVVYESSTPSNLNDCRNARPLLRNSPPLVPPPGSEEGGGGSSTATNILEPCAEGPAPTDDGAADGLWYTYTTTTTEQQQLVQVPLCDGVRSVQVYTAAADAAGVVCDQLQCQSRYNVQSTESCSRNLVFATGTTPNTVYYLYVVADNMLDFGGFDFGGTVSVLPLFEPAPNRECAAALALPLPADGTAQIVEFDKAFDWSQDYNPETPTLPALWYSLAANGGNPHRVQICGPVQMQVSRGSDSGCSQAVPAVEPPVYLSSGCQTLLLDSEETTATATTTQYYFQLQALAGATHRAANLTVWELDGAQLAFNANCQSAEGPLVAPVAASLVDPIVAGGPQDMALFYYVDKHADGNFLRGTVCRTSSAATDFEVSLEQSSLEFCKDAVTQSSGTLVSDIDGNGCRSIAWRSALNSGVLIIGVHAQQDMDFTIQVQEADASILPTNDDMPQSYRLDNTGYVLLTLDNSPVQGSTANALSDAVDAFRGQFCENIVPNKPGVWFATSPGTGRDTVVCLKSDSAAGTSTAQLAVFGALLDIDAIYEGCLPDAEEYTDNSECTVALRWPALQDDLYSILVQTDGPESFELSMYTITDFIADPACLLPTIIAVDESTAVPTLTPGLAENTSPSDGSVAPSPSQKPSYSLIPTESGAPSASIAPSSSISPNADAAPPTNSSTDVDAVEDKTVSRGWARRFSWSCGLLSASVLLALMIL